MPTIKGRLVGALLSIVGSSMIKSNPPKPSVDGAEGLTRKLTA